ncbi:MAG: cysteine desulfurase-like protein [Gemmatimonadota bacterium]|nr:cysteine desulfurase-like protein [Gemmatimonadota bacterium]
MMKGGGTVLDVKRIRREFPALKRKHHDLPVAYFDGPGGTQVPKAVVEAMTDYLYHHNANTHWAYPTSIETDAALVAARAALADFLGARPDEIAFGANMTTLTFHLGRALGRRWAPGDEIIVTELDHHANIAPWQALSRERGVTIRTVPLDPARGELVWSELEAAFTPRTRLLAIGAASNALGTITDVEAAVGLARASGALSFVDAVHYAAHGPLDFQRIGADFLACSPYKFYGPHLGVLCARKELLESLDVPKLEPAPDSAPERIETGTLSHEAIVGARAAVDFLASLGAGTTRRERLLDAGQRLHLEGSALLKRLWNGLRRIKGVQLYGPPPTRPRTPTLSFSVAGFTAEAVARFLADRAVFVSHGDFYAATVARRLGRESEGLVRAGCACYTTPREVNRLLAGVKELVAAATITP